MRPKAHASIPDEAITPRQHAMGRRALREGVDEALWAKAKEKAAKQRDEDDPMFFGLVTHIYEQMGGTFAKTAERKMSADVVTEFGSLIRLASAIDNLPETSAADVICRYADGRTLAWAKTLPVNERFLYMGEWITLTEEKLKAIERNFDFGLRLNADYYHQGEPDVIAPPDAKISSGDVIDVEYRPGDGLWSLVHWTARASDFIKNGEMTHISAYYADEWIDKYTGKKVGPKLRSIALLSRPHLERNMKAVAAADRLTTQPVPPSGRGEDENNPPSEASMRNALIKSLKLSEKATDDEILKAVENVKLVDCPMCGKKMSGKCSECGAKFAEHEAERAKLAEAKAAAEKAADAAKSDVVKLADRVAKLETEKAATEAKQREAEATMFVDGLRDRCIILPAQYDATKAMALKDLAGVKALFEKATPIQGAKPAGHDHAPEGDDVRASFMEKVTGKLAEHKGDFEAAFEAVKLSDPDGYRKLSESYRPGAVKPS